MVWFWIFAGRWFKARRCTYLMCGIFGYSLKQTGALDLEAILPVIQHRGPDGRGFFYSDDGYVGLGHVRLAIIGLDEVAAQPYLSNDKQAVLTYNGEIYNFKKIAEGLKQEGVDLDDHSDTVVLFEFLQKHGLSQLNRLNGMFAFAFYNQVSGELYIVRDGYGVKPLYYAESEQGVLFASEVKALLAMGGESGALDSQTIARYNTYLWNPASELPTQNIKKLAPGFCLKIKQGQIIDNYRWFDLSRQAGLTKKGRDAKSYIAETAHHIRKAVHRQMVSDVEVGAFLSGGLDSTSVVAFAKELNPNIRCFTIDTGKSDAGLSDDLPYAKKAAKYLGVPLEVVKVEHKNLADDIESLVECLEEPLADPAPLNVLYISQLARKHGIKVLLSGAGGDDVFTGYRRHKAVLADRWLSKIPTILRKQMANAAQYFDTSNAFGRRAVRFLSGIELNGNDRLINYFAWIPDSALRPLFAKEFRAEVDRVNLSSPFRDYLNQFDSGLDDIEKILLLERRFFLADHNLTYTDKMSMAASVEVRVPFLDNELVEFAATIPSNLKQHGSVGKWVFKQAMRHYLPDSLIFRSKTGFGAPLRIWLGGELKVLVNDTLSQAAIQRRGIFDFKMIQKFLEDDRQGKIDGSYIIFSLMCFEIWCRKFIDQNEFNYKGNLVS